MAARLQALGDLVVGPVDGTPDRGLFELEELGDLELKGKSETVAAFRVTGVRAARPDLSGAAARRPREQELGELRDVLDRLLLGEGTIVSITGEPGIGKSRLVAEMARDYDGRIRFLAGHAVAYAETIPYWPVREQLRSWLGVGLSDAEARIRIELRAELARSLGDEAEDAYPFLATLLGLTLEPEQEQRLGGFASDAVQRQTFDWLFQLVCSLARERPLCLVLDDLHWSDEATLALLDELLPATEEVAVGFLLIHRSDPDHPAWHVVDRARRRFRHLFLELELEPLPDPDTRALAEADAEGELPERARGAPRGADGRQSVLRGRGDPRPARARCPRAGERPARARRRAVAPGGPPGDAPGADRPARPRGAGARHDRLRDRPFLRPAAPGAAAPTRAASTDPVRAPVAPAPRRGTPAARARVPLPARARPGGRVRPLVEARRRELHLRVGEALVELHRDSPAEVYGLLAHHFAEADEPERAVEYLLRGGRRGPGRLRGCRGDRALPQGARIHGAHRGRSAGPGDAVQDRAHPPPRVRLPRRQRSARRGVRALPHPSPSGASRASGSAGRRPPAWPVEATAPGITESDFANWVAINLFRGLVAIGRDFEIEPDLAECFTVSDDGLTYRFTLRPDARWSDGAPVTADDFAFTFAQMVEDDVDDRVLARRRRARARSTSARSRSGSPSRETTSSTCSVSPPLFAWPRHVYERRGREWYKDVPLVGNGPFVLTERRATGDARSPGRITLESAPTWYGARGNVREVRIELEASPEAAGDRWKRATTTSSTTCSPSERDIAGDETVVEWAPGGFTEYLGLDATRPPLDDVRIRRAVAHAIDRTAPALGRDGEAPRRRRVGCFRLRCPVTRTGSPRPSTPSAPARCWWKRVTRRGVESARSCWRTGGTGKT